MNEEGNAKLPERKMHPINTVAALEEQIYEREGLRVFLRLPAEQILIGESYCDIYLRKLGDNFSVSHLRQRIWVAMGRPKHFVEAIILDRRFNPRDINQRATLNLNVGRLRKPLVTVAP